MGIQMIEQRVSTPVLAAPGSHQLPQWAHRPALSHHGVFALRGLFGPNLHLHSGEFTFCPVGVTKTSLALPPEDKAAWSQTFFWVLLKE